MNAARKGNVGELRVAAELEDAGWLVASRRHIGGAGDLLAIRPDRMERRLVEVKARRNVWEGFRRPDRELLVRVAAEFNCEPWLAWVPSSTKPVQWISSDDWP